MLFFTITSHNVYGLRIAMCSLYFFECLVNLTSRRHSLKLVSIYVYKFLSNWDLGCYKPSYFDFSHMYKIFSLYEIIRKVFKNFWPKCGFSNEKDLDFMYFGRWVMSMFSSERKNMLQMHFAIWPEGFMQVRFSFSTFFRLSLGFVIYRMFGV